MPSKKVDAEMESLVDKYSSTYRLRDWSRDALCAEKVAAGEAEPEWWTDAPHNTRQGALGIAICHQCPVREACLRTARDTVDQGTWGGTTRWERSHLPVARLLNRRNPYPDGVPADMPDWEPPKTKPFDLNAHREWVRGRLDELTAEEL